MATLLLLGLSAQFAWQYRHHPQVYRLLDSASQAAGIMLPVMRAPDQFVVENRLFTRIENSDKLFQLQLEFSNQAAWPQPYPVIELTLTDKHSIPRARQSISPEEYLQQADNPLIPAGESVEISFVAESSSEEISGFSLEFL